MAKRFFTRDASKGMDLENGKRHYDSNGKPLGGIKAKVVNTDNQQIEVEQGEVIITRDAVSNPKKYKIEGTTKEILSTLNQEGGGVPINESEAEILAKYKTGGKIPPDINKLSLNEFEKYLEEKYNSKVELGDYKKYIYLGRIEVDKETRGLGIGSEIMSEIIDYADYNDKKITLTPSTDYGASSVARLKEFYKNFGFIENKGRNKDFEISQSMYRVPVNEKYHLGGDMTKHLAPNGKPSNLNHEQWHLVRTPEFKAWFGDWENDPENSSKVVDENGEPLVVYHGTNYNFNIFQGRKAYYFAEDKKYADFIIDNYRGRKEYSKVLECFLSIKKIVKVKFLIETNIVALFLNENKYLINKKAGLYGKDDIEDDYISKLKGIDTSVYVCLHPNQIKLADGSNTTFDENNDDIRYKEGGNISNMTPSEIKAFYDTPEGKKLDAETYAEWKRLVNMSKSELEKFYNSVEGKEAGLSPEEAKEQGINYGRESARWIMKMKDIPYKQWTSNMWRWAKDQIDFIKRMSGMRGDLYNDKGEKTRKHTALLIWGHNPERKFKGGGEISQKALAVETTDLKDYVRKYFIKDGRIDVSDAMQEMFGNKRGKSIADEYRKRIGLHKKGGLTISELAHKLWEEHKNEVRGNIDDSDFREAVEDVISSEYGVSSMIKSLMEKSDEGIEDEEAKYWANQFDENEYSSDDEQLTDEEMSMIFRDMEQAERELAKGTKHEMEHLATLKKVAEGKVTPEEAVVETASTHIAENPQYYEDLQKMELENEESIPDLIEGLKVLAESLEGAEKKEIEDVIEGLEILLESDDKEVVEKKSDKIKVIFPNTDSGYDKDAQKFILDFIKRYKGAKLAKHADENKNYELYVIYDNSYPSESEIYVTDSIEKAYNKSLDVDVRELNIVKAKKNNETIIYDYYNGDIFANYMGEKYDEKGDLKKEVKEKVINNIKRHFNRDWEGNLVEGKVLWATKIGEPDYNEQLITENSSQIENAKKWAMENGFDRIRVSKIDMSSKPDFTQGFKKYAEGGEFRMATGGKIVFKPITTPL